MAKGANISLPVIFGIVVFSGALVVSFLGIQKVAQLLGWNWSGDGSLNPSLEKAILCSYNRCKYGCGDSRLDDLTWNNAGESVSCGLQYCGDVPDVFKSDNKLCGWYSQQYPVEVITNERHTISKDVLKVFDCILDKNAQGNFLDSILSTINIPQLLYNEIVSLLQGQGFGTFKILIVSDSLISSATRADCSMGGSYKFSNTITKATIKAIPIYVDTFDISIKPLGLVELGRFEASHVSNEPNYTKLDPGIVKTPTIQWDSANVESLLNRISLGGETNWVFKAVRPDPSRTDVPILHIVVYSVNLPPGGPALDTRIACDSSQGLSRSTTVYQSPYRLDIYCNSYSYLFNSDEDINYFVYNVNMLYTKS